MTAEWGWRRRTTRRVYAAERMWRHIRDYMYLERGVGHVDVWHIAWCFHLTCLLYDLQGLLVTSGLAFIQ